MLKLSSSSKRWIFMVALLLAETEALLFGHYREKIAVRTLVHLPLYRWLMVFLLYSALFHYLSKAKKENFEPTTIAGRALGLHVVFTGILYFLITPLWLFTDKVPVANWLWVAMMLAYLGTWLACLVRPQRWLETLCHQGLWIPIALAASGVTVFAATAFTQFWQPLSAATFWCSGSLLQLFFDDTVILPDEMILGTSNFEVRINPQCSGYEGMGLILAYTVVYLWLRRKDLCFPQALSLLPVGVLVIWIANTFRIAFLVALGSLVSPTLARGSFHSQAGWIAFSIIGASMGLLVEKLQLFRSSTVESEYTSTVYPSVPLLLPLAVLLFAWILSQAFSQDFDYFYPLRMVAVSLVLLRYAAMYRELLCKPGLSAVWLGVAVYLLWVALVPQAATQIKTPLDALQQPWLSLWLILRVLGAVVVIPMTEELAFRGFLLRALQSKHFEEIPIGKITGLSLLGSSLAFGLLHQQVLAGTLAGLAYGYSTKWRGGWSNALTAHATTNLCLAIQVLTLQQWSLWI